jgi:hypothetical protein
MKNRFLPSLSFLVAVCAALLTGYFLALPPQSLDASSHREAPLISNDPLADNTDLYAFRSPDNPTTVTIIANYIPLELPEGGPNWATFGENIRYEIHIKNKTSVGALGTAADDITYRFTFRQVNEDTTTFFNIRLGRENLKTTYTCEKSTDGGRTFTTIVSNGIVPPNNIGPRSIEGAAGKNTRYETLVQGAITTASTGERIFCGPRDDAFFVDLGGVFDLGQTRSSFGADPRNPANARDAVAGFNTHAICLQIPIQMLQKDGKPVSQAANILDPDFVIGVWASAARPQIQTLSSSGAKPTYSGPWVQVSRLGMPLTNEAVIPIGAKDRWNAVTPYSVEEQSFVDYFANPELALYMDDSQFGAAVPALAALRVQSRSYPALGTITPSTTPGLDFRNGKDGAFALTRLNPVPNLTGTAVAVPLQPGLVAAGKPRLVDIFPIFYFGVPNLIPYQLATGKTGGPLSAGKPFIHNFLPVTQTSDGRLFGGDMLRLNMATPPTARTSMEFRQNARQGLIRAAAIGLTAAPFNTNRNLEAIPHMDGFPNGRRLEDDVTTIALQAVGGLVLAAVGLGFDDAVSPAYADLASPQLVRELTYNAGPTENDLPILPSFPYEPTPHRGYDYVKQLTTAAPGQGPVSTPTSVAASPGVSSTLGLSAPLGGLMDVFPNPASREVPLSLEYFVSKHSAVMLRVYNANGQAVATIAHARVAAGRHTVSWKPETLAAGAYVLVLEVDGQTVGSQKIIVAR